MAAAAKAYLSKAIPQESIVIVIFSFFFAFLSACSSSEESSAVPATSLHQSGTQRFRDCAQQKIPQPMEQKAKYRANHINEGLVTPFASFFLTADARSSTTSGSAWHSDGSH